MLSQTTMTALAAAMILANQAQAIVLPNNLGKLPHMGFNSYYAYKCNVVEANLVSAGNYMVSLGLKSLGYTYVNVDDCWSVKSGRDSSTGRLVPSSSKFPKGISGTAATIHALGLKFGIYSSAGALTCAGYPGSLGHEDLDAQTFGEWGVDYLKYDNCPYPSTPADKYKFCVPDTSNSKVDPGPYKNGSCPSYTNLAPSSYDWSTSYTAQRFTKMHDAIANQSYPMLYSLCEWGQADVTKWGPAIASSWRTTGDSGPNWKRIAEILTQNSFLLNVVDFWAHNDADMLLVGSTGLTAAESRTQFAFWAAIKSPLIISTNLAKISTANLAILKNTYLINFNQDSTYGKPAKPYKWGYTANWTFDAAHPPEYWSGSSSNGVLVLMLNTDAVTASRTATWSEVPELKGAAYMVTDIWTGASLGCVKTGITRSLGSHDTAGFLVGKAC